MKKLLGINLTVLTVCFNILIYSCKSNKANPTEIYCQTNTIQVDCMKIELSQLLESADKFDSRCITSEGYFSYRSEDAGIYLSPNDIRNYDSQNAIWVDISSSIVACVESKINLFQKQKVVVTGMFNSKKKGHLSAYGGEITNVTYIKVIDK